MPRSIPWALLAVIAASAGCSKDSAAVKPTPSAVPSASAPAPSTSTSAAPSASASAAPEAKHDCPAGSTGVGSFSHPCEAKGPKTRMALVTWTGKNDEHGSPWFRVQNKAPKPLLYAHLAIYFYDKAGKQIDAKEPVEGSDKTHAFHSCSGNVFSGGLNPSETARFTFSCMKKADVPDGTTAIEAEATMVGFADASMKKNDFYWRNIDLAPDKRPKGGAK